MKRFDNVAKRLSFLMDGAGKVPSDLNKDLGISFPQVSRWMSGNVLILRGKNAQLLADYFQCKREWIATGDGDPFEKVSDINNHPLPTPHQHAGVPAGQASIAPPSDINSFSQWLVNQPENERYEKTKAGLISLGTPPGEVPRIMAEAIELPVELQQALPQELARRFDAIWNHVCGETDTVQSSWKERYRKQYLAGTMSDSELYVAALEWVSTHKIG